ncbi:Prolyl 4-hydroxylase subunit alpha-3 [Bulinus truncatus]|nr:Prolyl 4-hydroxylase subunit alpha-3 [Bulinus truncatus]
MGQRMEKSFQVTVNYGIGGHYTFHYDAVKRITRDLTFLDRVATFLIYLNDVDKGGSTVFRDIQLSVAPRKNMALFWYNFNTAHHLDNGTEHAGCPIVHGRKWIATKWIRGTGSIFRRRCGLRPDVTQLDIEEDMKRGYR